jgi:MoxR-like ATPase
MTTPNTLQQQEYHVTMDVAVQLLEELTEAGDKVMLWGSPGIGKTSIVEQLGARKNRKVITFIASLREPVDVRGIPVTDPLTKTTVWYVPSELPQVERDGEEGYLFLDEINAGSQQMMSVMMGLVETGIVGDYHLPKGWRIVAAGNRVSDRAVAQRMPTALRNRLAHIFIVPDVPAFAKWANKNGIAPELVAFVRMFEKYLHMMPKGDENAFPTPRSLVKAAKYINAPKHLRLRLFAAHIGDAVAGEFDAFIDLYRTIGTLDGIVADPDGSPIPTEPSIRFATCTGLARIATRKTLPNIIKYAERLPREPQILVVIDATDRDESLKNTAAYGAWAVKNQDVLLQN